MGWYQTAPLGCYQTTELIETFVNYYDNNIKRCVCLVFNPQRAARGSLAFTVRAIDMCQLQLLLAAMLLCLLFNTQRAARGSLAFTVRAIQASQFPLLLASLLLCLVFDPQHAARSSFVLR